MFDIRDVTPSFVVYDSVDPQNTRRRFALMPVTERRPLMQKAAAAPDRALGAKRNWEEMLSSLLL